MEKFQNKYRIPSSRLKGYDYGSQGMYFVTICTKNKNHYFGTIVETDDCPSPINTNDCPFPINTNDCPSQKQNNTEPDNHLVLQNKNHNRASNETHNRASNETHNRTSLRETEIGKIAREFWGQIPQHFPFVELDEFIVMPNHIHGILFINKPDKSDWNSNTFGTQTRNLASIIRAYKSSVKRFANQNEIEFEWQSRYHDRIIRDFNECSNIREYILNNPQKWANDEYYSIN